MTSIRRIFVVIACFLATISCLSVVVSAQQNHGERLANDPELLQAMELFMGMSAQEREETIKGLMAAVGDDPAAKQEMERLIQMLGEMDDTSSLKQMIHDDELAKAKQQAQKQLDGMTWESFWASQAEILEATVASGQLSPEDAALFQTDTEAWKRQLRMIFDDLASDQ